MKDWLDGALHALRCLLGRHVWCRPYSFTMSEGSFTQGYRLHHGTRQQCLYCGTPGRFIPETKEESA